MDAQARIVARVPEEPHLGADLDAAERPRRLEGREVRRPGLIPAGLPVPSLVRQIDLVVDIMHPAVGTMDIAPISPRFLLQNRSGRDDGRGRQLAQPFQPAFVRFHRPPPAQILHLGTGGDPFAEAHFRKQNQVAGHAVHVIDESHPVPLKVTRPVVELAYRDLHCFLLS